MFSYTLPVRKRFFILLTLLAVGMFESLVPAFAQQEHDAANISVRLGVLEEQIRKLNGEIEQLQHENLLLRQKLEKTATTSGLNPAQQKPDSDKKSPSSRADSREAFNPEEHPDAAGVPQPLGSTQGSHAQNQEPQGSPSKQNSQDDNGFTLNGIIEDAGSADKPSAPDTENDISSSEEANTPDDQNALDEFLTAQDYMQSEQYEKAEFQFKKYLHDHPKDANVPSAIYGLGQSYAKRGRHREAAEQYILIATDYKNSETAPDSMVKLGISLQAMGVTDKACALFSEVRKRYPNADPMVLKAADKEKRSLCKL